MDLSRRNFLISTATVATCQGLGVKIAQPQALSPVKLLVLRKPGLSISNHCVAPCIRGRIFDVSDIADFGMDKLVVANLRLRPSLCDIIERPYKGNKPFISSIPKNIYKAKIRHKRTKSWMNTVNKRWRIELLGVPRRSAIQFHYGKDVNWSQGCFIVGTTSPQDGRMTGGYCKIKNSEKAIEALRRAVTAPGRDPSRIEVAVVDDGGLFPDFKRPAC